MFYNLLYTYYVYNFNKIPLIVIFQKNYKKQRIKSFSTFKMEYVNNCKNYVFIDLSYLEIYKNYNLYISLQKLIHISVK